MHLLREQQKIQLFCLFVILITQTISVPIKETVQNIRCNILHQNCTFIQQNSVPSESRSSPTYLQGSAIWAMLRATRQRTTARLTLTTPRQRSTTRDSSGSNFDSFSDNLKRAALILAGVALGLGVLRVCLMLCKSRSGNSSLSNRHSSTVRPQVATVEQHPFKPDLPPGYAEAMANRENDGGKLPTYDELPYDEREQQHVYHNDGFMSTRM